MVTIKKAEAKDFEKIYPLLTTINNSPLTKEDWKKLFSSAKTISKM